MPTPEELGVQFVYDADGNLTDVLNTRGIVLAVQAAFDLTRMYGEKVEAGTSVYFGLFGNEYLDEFPASKGSAQATVHLAGKNTSVVLAVEKSTDMFERVRS